MKFRLPTTLAVIAVGLTACSSTASVTGSGGSTTISSLVVGETAAVTTLDAAKYGPASVYGVNA